jgi:hypothetical protein
MNHAIVDDIVKIIEVPFSPKAVRVYEQQGDQQGATDEGRLPIE